MSNTCMLDPDLAPCFVGPDLHPNCLQRLHMCVSADDKIVTRIINLFLFCQGSSPMWKISGATMHEMQACDCVTSHRISDIKPCQQAINSSSPNVSPLSTSTNHCQYHSMALIFYKERWYPWKYMYLIWARAWDFQQCGMCDQQSLRSACAYAQSDQSLC